MTLVIAALPSFEQKLRDIETLASRVTMRIELTSLSEQETRDLIQKRIEHSGGSGIKPFTEQCVKEIYRHSGGFPREILKICDNLVYKAIEEGKKQVDSVEKIESPKPVTDFMRDIPYRQKKIIRILSSGDMLPGEIVERMGTKGYKTKEHAIRSVNNILRRLMSEGYVSREKRGKGYIYSLNTKIKNLLVEA
jgi:DNA-binding transcriptional ArsR family regulator